MAYEVGDIVSYKFDDMRHILKGMGLIINNLDSGYAVYDEVHMTVVRELHEIDITLLRSSDVENKRKAEKFLKAYSEILKNETSTIVSL